MSLHSEIFQVRYALGEVFQYYYFWGEVGKISGLFSSVKAAANIYLSAVISGPFLSFDPTSQSQPDCSKHLN